MTREKRLHETRQFWDNEAPTFDDEPDHGLNDPTVLDAWTQLLEHWLPPPQAKILDVGCGTGSLSILIAKLGHVVTGIDLSPAMISHAERKAAMAGHRITFHVMEASNPSLAEQQFDGIVCRHLLWALPNIAAVLQRWAALLKPGGCLLLVEGYWHTGGGLHSEEIIEALPPNLTNVSVQNLSNQPDFWGGNVNDERYAIMAE
ncbi:MAG: class I SAM-dependent methyltransferase [Gammaproteobacteria bacterium]|nr:class I SAM-dependent methyltransferase [Gammaproteobacteria bacterium]